MNSRFAIIFPKLFKDSTVKCQFGYCSFVGNLTFLSNSFCNFFFSFITRWEFFFNVSVWYSTEFFKLGAHVFLQLWKILSHFLFFHCFITIFSIVNFWILKSYIPCLLPLKKNLILPSYVTFWNTVHLIFHFTNLLFSSV